MCNVGWVWSVSLQKYWLSWQQPHTGWEMLTSLANRSNWMDDLRVDANRPSKSTFSEIHNWSWTWLFDAGLVISYWLIDLISYWLIDLRGEKFQPFLGFVVDASQGSHRCQRTFRFLWLVEAAVGHWRAGRMRAMLTEGLGWSPSFLPLPEWVTVNICCSKWTLTSVKWH